MRIRDDKKSSILKGPSALNPHTTMLTFRIFYGRLPFLFACLVYYFISCVLSVVIRVRVSVRASVIVFLSN